MITDSEFAQLYPGLWQSYDGIRQEYCSCEGGGMGNDVGCSSCKMIDEIMEAFHINESVKTSHNNSSTAIAQICADMDKELSNIRGYGINQDKVREWERKLRTA